MNHIEESNQIAFVSWFRLQYPKYKKRITLPSFGVNIGPVRMRKLKKMGLTSGYPDIFIAVPRMLSVFDYSCGLFIEMKAKGEKAMAHQLEIHNELRESRYIVEICYSSDEAIKVTKEYFKDVVI